MSPLKKKPKARKLSTGLKPKRSSRVATTTTAKPSKSIRIERPLVLPLYVREALTRLGQSGFEAYVVGGSVRDALLGRTIKDFDIATDAKPDELCALFLNAITVGKQFGVIKVPLSQTAEPLEIATFREDLEYLDHRRPTGVKFADIGSDATRRDFTINALFYDPKGTRVLDFCGGYDDLKAKILRAIGDPEVRFEEDALRLLRAIRFSTELGFKIEENTQKALVEKAKLITNVSGERIRDELTKMWMGPAPAQALVLLEQTGLLKWVLPEIEALVRAQVIGDHQRDLWTHVKQMLELLNDNYPKRSSAMSWAALLWDVGKPISAQKNKNSSLKGHEREAEGVVRSLGDRLHWSKSEIESISWMLANQLKIKEVFKMREATLLRFLREPGFEDLLKIHKLDAILSEGNLAAFDFWSKRFEKFKSEGADSMPKIIDGTDLIQLGFDPGPQFSEILRVVEDLALERKLTSKEQALEFVIKNYVH